jgi:hypothetical protein
MAGETVIRIAYGLPCLERDDPYVAVAEKAVMPMFVAAIPGNYLVDHLPWLKNIPTWIPGTFKHHAKEWKDWALAMLHEPYDDAKKLIVSVLDPFLRCRISEFRHLAIWQLRALVHRG